MSTEVPAQTVRIVAYNAAQQRQNSMKVVNIATTVPTSLDKNNHVPKAKIQAAGNPTSGVYPTYMAAGAADAITPGLPTVYIPGYAGPA
jgi:hypothetical protein